jgi:hypothetical protein
MKHGEAEEVRRVYRRHWDALQGGDEMAADLLMIEIPVASLTQPMVDEINACLAVTGRASGLPERLERMSSEAATAPKGPWG